MIIVCPECSTKFNVNSERIPAGGAKVRCARCKHVFLAENPPSNEPLTTTFKEDVDQESISFSYEQFQDLDTQETEESTANFSFGDEEPSGTVQTSQPRAATRSEAEDEFSFAGHHEEPVAEPAANRQSVQAESENRAFPHSAGEPEAATPQRVARPKKKSGPWGTIISLVLLLLLAAVILIGLNIYINGPDQFNQTIKEFLGQQDESPTQTGSITLTDLEGKFMQNEQVGEVFLIRGKAINNYATPRSAIQVKGVIFDQSGEQLLQKTVFCGNPISDHEVQTLSFNELEKMMGNQFGKELSNMKVNSKQTIPFDIVFKDLPKNLAEFSVNVTSSKPANN
ncbi:DUF3426 domain-containing protein [Pelobacter seleniigenes]|uniref:DUF3426 domain-containing protein n=1 Tax=Pelobacter seleniigenes TaxID=407188 RepID=UPI0004A77436|nr:DUF3426 domain-containing protein [Pelobacter seleniigenes]